MYFPTYLTLGLLASLANTAPTAMDSINPNITSLTAQSPTLLHNSKATTKTSKVPSYCSFPANEFYYLPFTYLTRQACIGIDIMDETPTPWSPLEYSNIYAAMNIQVTKDGIFKTSQVGCWVANFEKLTSAIKDREGYKGAFFTAMETFTALREAGFQRFYFQFDGGFVVVRRLGFC